MATYEVHGSDGAMYRIEGPDNADPSAIIAQVTGGHKFGSGKSLDYDPTTGQTHPTGSPEAKALESPTSGQSSIQNFLAGAGKATVDLGRGAAQLGAGVADLVNPREQTLSGLVTGKPQSRVDEWRQAVTDARTRDAPLMNTGAGNAGFITGNIADMLPAAFIPGAGTLAGAGAIGAATGLAQPSASTGETLANVGLGAATGPGALLLGRGAAAVGKGAVAALEPLFRGGQERIAARTLQAFAGGPQDAQAAAAAIQNAPAVLPGVQPTTAELANNAGIAQLERTLRNNPEALQALTARNQGNRAAMTGALDQIAGTPQQLNAATTARTAATRPMYDAAGQAVVPADAELGRLLSRPSMTRAWDRAQQLAAERGVQLAQPNANDVSGQTLQYLKMGLNDMRDAGRQSGIGAHEQRALDSTLADLNAWTTRNVPQLRAADTSFRTLSQPINQMEVGGALRDRLVPALGDFGNNTRLSAASYATAVRNGDQLAATATGQPQLGLRDVLSPDQVRTVHQVGEQLARRANADELGRASGSNTAQNLASQNVLRQFLGPLGLPQNMGERAAQSTLGQTLLRPMQFVAAAGEPRILQRLADASLNPQEAARLLQLARTNPRVAQMLWARQGLLGPIAQQTQQGLLGTNAPQ